MFVTGSHLPAVATSEQDEHSPRGDGGAQVPLVLAEGLLSMTLQFAGNILCGVVAGLQKEHTHLSSCNSRNDRGHLHS